MKKTMNKVAALGLVLASVVALAAPAQAEVKLPNGLSFGSTIFADYTSYSNNVAPTATVFDAQNGFHITRAYLYLKDKIDDNLSARITLDTSTSPTAGATVFLKHAYLDYAVNENVTVEAGLGGTPWVPFVEKLWGYRSIGDSLNAVAGKVLSDRVGALSSSDAGVAVLGTVGAINYQVGAYNGEGYNGAANGGGLKIGGRLGYEDASGLGIAAYYDTETKRNGTLNYDPTRTAAVIYFKQPTFTIAGEYLMANDFTGTVAPAGVRFADANGFSVFGNVKVIDSVRLFARYDAMTNNTRTGYAGNAAPAATGNLVSINTLNTQTSTITAGATYILAKDQEVSVEYSSFNNGVLPTSVTTNTLSVNLLTGF